MVGGISVVIMCKEGGWAISWIVFNEGGRLGYQLCSYPGWAGYQILFVFGVDGLVISCVWVIWIGY